MMLMGSSVGHSHMQCILAHKVKSYLDVSSRTGNWTRVQAFPRAVASSFHFALCLFLRKRRGGQLAQIFCRAHLYLFSSAKRRRASRLRASFQLAPKLLLQSVPAILSTILTKTSGNWNKLWLLLWSAQQGFQGYARSEIIPQKSNIKWHWPTEAHLTVQNNSLTKNGFVIITFQPNAFLSCLDEKVPHKFIVQINFS